MQTTVEAAAQAVQHFEETALAFAAREGLFAPDIRVIAACSGGADSMALLLFLLRQKARLGIRLEVCHVNHGLRGESANRDEAFVAEFCRAHGLCLHRFSPRPRRRKTQARIGPASCATAFLHPFCSSRTR